MNVAIQPAGAGTVSVTPHSVPQEIAGDYETWYELSATPNNGFAFSHFSWQLHSWWERLRRPGVKNDEVTNSLTSTTNPISSQSSDLTDSKLTAGPYVYFQEILNVTAHFTGTAINVTTRAVPARAGVTSGGGSYAAGTAVTISTHEKCSPWVFDHWVLTPGGIIVSTASHTFTPSSNVVCEAMYRHTNTGAPYHNTNGEILCDDNGNIFYDGDLVTPSQS